MITLVLVVVGALVLAALVVAGGGLDRSRRMRRTRVVEQPVEQPVERVVVERPVARVRRRVVR